MPDEIAPALTPETLRREQDFGIETPLARAIGVVVLSDEYRGRHNEGLRALMAIANYSLPDGHPGKIIWAMVDGLRQMAASKYESDRLMDAEGPHVDADLCEQLANILASLLPPRTGR